MDWPYMESLDVGELQLVFIVRDKDAGEELDVAHTPKYT